MYVPTRCGREPAFFSVAAATQAPFRISGLNLRRGELGDFGCPEFGIEKVIDDFAVALIRLPAQTVPLGVKLSRQPLADSHPRGIDVHPSVLLSQALAKLCVSILFGAVNRCRDGSARTRRRVCPEAVANLKHVLASRADVSGFARHSSSPISGIVVQSTNGGDNSYMGMNRIISRCKMTESTPVKGSRMRRR